MVLHKVPGTIHKENQKRAGVERYQAIGNIAQHISMGGNWMMIGPLYSYWVRFKVTHWGCHIAITYFHLLKLSHHNRQTSTEYYLRALWLSPLIQNYRSDVIRKSYLRFIVRTSLHSMSYCYNDYALWIRPIPSDYTNDYIALTRNDGSLYKQQVKQICRKYP